MVGRGWDTHGWGAWRRRVSRSRKARAMGVSRSRGRALPGRGLDDPVVVVRKPGTQALVGRRPDQLEAHRAHADVDVGQLARELARRHLDLHDGAAAVLEWSEYQCAAL